MIHGLVRSTKLRTSYKGMFARKRPKQVQLSVVASFRMIGDILSDDLSEFLSFNWLRRCAKSAGLEMKVVNKRHGFADPINIA